MDDFPEITLALGKYVEDFVNYLAKNFANFFDFISDKFLIKFLIVKLHTLLLRCFGTCFPLKSPGGKRVLAKLPGDFN